MDKKTGCLWEILLIVGVFAVQLLIMETLWDTDFLTWIKWSILN